MNFKACNWALHVGKFCWADVALLAWHTHTHFTMLCVWPVNYLMEQTVNLQSQPWLWLCSWSSYSLQSKRSCWQIHNDFSCCWHGLAHFFKENKSWYQIENIHLRRDWVKVGYGFFECTFLQGKELILLFNSWKMLLTSNRKKKHWEHTAISWQICKILSICIYRAELEPDYE